jgi:hypothetical protein
LGLDGWSDPALIQAALLTLKGLVWDRGACHGWLVLTDPHFFYSLTPDHGRHTYSWVGDFTPAEADAHLDELGALTATDEQALRADVHANVSTRAIALDSLSCELASSTGVPAREVVRNFIRKAQVDEERRVHNLIGVARDEARLEHGMPGVHLIRLMKAMLLHGGTLPINNAFGYMCSSAVIADVLKRQEHHAVVVNPVTRMFVFSTPSDRMAAELLLGEYDTFDDGFGAMPMA